MEGKEVNRESLKVRGAWYIDQLPQHMVLELPDGTLTMVRIAPFRQITEQDFMQYKGYHPRKCKGQPLPEYMYRFYGLIKVEDDIKEETIHIRLTTAEKEAVQAAAERAGKTVSEFVRDWIRSL
ncbi:MAG: DUF1778 domain-containing protein [Treponemataceae bacterium]|nr:DUF1778 domain-containing protein [Treponemataceae bacterium]